MSIAKDERYIWMLVGRIENLRQVAEGRFQCRCPLCGDGTHGKNRGYFIAYQDVDAYRWKCHNCDEKAGWTLKNFLRSFAPDLYSEYTMEEFVGVNVEQKHTYTLLQKTKSYKRSKLAPLFQSNPSDDPTLDLLTKIDDLPIGHKARDYIDSRLFPNDKRGLIYYTKDFRKFAIAFQPETIQAVEKFRENEERIVIPFFDESGKMFAFQGRSLESGEEVIRYLTVKKHINDEKVFGLERINKNKKVVVVEGPFDSLFIPNCVATCDANLISYKHGDLYIPDFQYRNRDVCKYVQNLIDAGKSVCLWQAPQKDINDLIKSGMSHKEVLYNIATHVYSGVDAELEFANITRKGY